MTPSKLDDDHYEDIHYLITDVENEFDLKFSNDDFKEAASLGELLDIISNKIPLNESENCTTQQAFYKIRAAFKNIDDVNHLTPNTSLELLLPKKRRLSKVKELERDLGVKLRILSPPGVIASIIWVAVFVSLAGLMYDWRMFLPYFLLIVAIGKVAYRFGKELDLETISDLATKLTTDHYLASRRDPATINKKEFSQVLMNRLNKNYDEDQRLSREIMIA